MVLGNFQCPGVLQIWMIVGKGLLCLQDVLVRIYWEILMPVKSFIHVCIKLLTGISWEMSQCGLLRQCVTLH